MTKLHTFSLSEEIVKKLEAVGFHAMRQNPKQYRHGNGFNKTAVVEKAIEMLYEKLPQEAKIREPEEIEF